MSRHGGIPAQDVEQPSSKPGSDRGNLALLGGCSSSSQATNTLVGCVDDEPYGTVLYSLLHARLGPGDDRSLRIHCLGIMDFFSFGQLRWISQASLVCLLAVLSGFLLPLTPRAESGGNSSGRVSLDFNDVELSVFVRFISELTGKNFVLDEVVKIGRAHV